MPNFTEAVEELKQKARIQLKEIEESKKDEFQAARELGLPLGIFRALCKNIKDNAL